MVKILFICRSNVGRSQIAAALYNQLTKTSDAISAGTEVTRLGETLGEYARDHVGRCFVLQVMAQYGSVDLSSNVRNRVTKQMVSDVECVVSMIPLPQLPDWLRENAHLRYWPIADPGGRSFSETKAVATG